LLVRKTLRLPYWLLSVLPVSGLALQPMSESELARVDGQDGMTVAFDGSALSAQQVRWEIDTPVPSEAGGLYINGLSLTKMNTPDTLLNTELDVGSDGSDAFLSINSELARSRLAVEGMTLASEPGRSFGHWALVAPLEFRLQNRGIFFRDETNNPASLYIGIEDASLFYRQNWFYHANITFDNLDFLWDMPQGSVGVTSDGLRVAGDVNYLLNFDLLYKFHPDQDMTTVTANDKPMLNFGWEGTLYDTVFEARGGGVWDSTETSGSYDYSNRSGGINFGLSWNYKKNQGDVVKPTDLRWQIGRAGGNQSLLEFGDWRNLQDGSGNRVAKGFDFPNITLDVVPANQGPGGLCWGAGLNGSGCAPAGGKMLEFSVGNIAGYSANVNRSNADAMLALIREGNLLAYSNQVTVSAQEDASTGYAGMTPETYNWGLIYTLANINANLSLYPGGSQSDVPGSESNGFMADVLLMTQTLDGSHQQGDNWAKGTHFLIADTDPTVNMGLGMINSQFLLAADDMRVWLKNTWSGTDGTNAYEGGIDLLSPRARMQFKGLLGGVSLPRGDEVVGIAGMDLNLEGLANFRISPPPDGENFLAYSSAIRLYSVADQPGSNLASGQGSFWSISEPGRADVELRLADIQGDIAITEGRLELTGRNETGAGEPPQLTLSNKILFGASAQNRINDGVAGLTNPSSYGGQVGQAVKADVYFGADRLGDIVVPNGTLKATIGLLPQ